MSPDGLKVLKYVIGSSIVVMASTATDPPANDELFSIISFNLHGLNNSKSYLIDLCSNSDVLILIGAQEHWLSPIWFARL
jgi:hypothetical protein